MATSAEPRPNRPAQPAGYIEVLPPEDVFIDPVEAQKVGEAYPGNRNTLVNPEASLIIDLGHNGLLSIQAKQIHPRRGGHTVAGTLRTPEDILQPAVANLYRRTLFGKWTHQQVRVGLIKLPPEWLQN